MCQHLSQQKKSKSFAPILDSLSVFSFNMVVMYEVYWDIWKYVLVDEFQYIDEIQYDYFCILSIGNARIFIFRDAY